MYAIFDKNNDRFIRKIANRNRKENKLILNLTDNFDLAKQYTTKVGAKIALSYLLKWKIITIHRNASELVIIERK